MNSFKIFFFLAQYFWVWLLILLNIEPKLIAFSCNESQQLCLCYQNMWKQVYPLVCTLAGLIQAQSLRSVQSPLGTLSACFTEIADVFSCLCTLLATAAVWWSVWLKHDLVALRDKQLNVVLEPSVPAFSFSEVFYFSDKSQVDQKWQIQCCFSGV